MTKAEILQKVANAQQKIIDTIQSDLSNFNSQTELDENDIIDRDDLSQQDEGQEMRSTLAVQLQQAKNKLSNIQSFAEDSHSQAEPGALVETDRSYFILGLETPTVKLDDHKSVHSVSLESDLFKTIRGKKTGDTFNIHGLQYTVQNVL